MDAAGAAPVRPRAGSVDGGHAVSLWQELRRRHVVRVAVIYAGAAFVVLQVVQLVGEGLDLPAWVFRAITLATLAGFPIALVLAWALELSADGVRRESSLPGGERQARAPIPLWQKLAGVVVVALLMGTGWWATRPSPAHYDSIAVLPFTDSSAVQHGDYFGDGLAEELLNSLGNVPSLRVAARTSAFSFKGSHADVREIAAKLGVVTVLEGSVRRGDGRVRINAQLIDAKSGFQIWHGDYERDDSDLFALQNRMAREIVDALSVKLGVVDKDTLVRGGTRNAQAYDLYLKARERWRGREVPELLKALPEMRKAVRLDPGFALGWCGLSDVIDALAWRDPQGVPLLPEGKAASLRALALAPDLPDAWASMGIIHGEFDHDWVTAEHALQHAVALRPSYAQAMIWLADVSRYQGHFDAALAMYARSVAADPLSDQFKQNYANQLARYGDPGQALDLLKQVVATHPRQPEALGTLASNTRFALGADERAGYARRWAEVVGASDPGRFAVIGRAIDTPALRPQALLALDELHAEIGWNEFLPKFAAALGDRERTLALLEEGQKKNVGGVLGAGVNPQFAFVAKDPRFKAVIAAQGLPIVMSKESGLRTSSPNSSAAM